MHALAPRAFQAWGICETRGPNFASHCSGFYEFKGSARSVQWHKSTKKRLQICDSLISAMHSHANCFRLIHFRSISLLLARHSALARTADPDSRFSSPEPHAQLYAHLTYQYLKNALPVRLGNTLQLVLLLNSVAVAATLGSVDQLLSQALSNRLDVSERGLTCTDCE